MNGDGSVELPKKLRLQCSLARLMCGGHVVGAGPAKIYSFAKMAAVRGYMYAGCRASQESSSVHASL